MRSTVSDPTWRQISPLLDEAINQLKDSERSAVLLRYYKGSSYREVAESLGKTEAAGRQQVSRALRKLSGFLRRRGVTTTATVLGTGMASHLSAAVPTDAAAMISQGALAGAAGVGKTDLILNSIQTMTYAKTKTAVAVAVLAAIPIGLQWNQIRDLRHKLAVEHGDVRQAVIAKSDKNRNPAAQVFGSARHRVGERAGVVGERRTARSPHAADWQRALYEQDPVKRAQRIADLIADLDPQAAPAIAELFFGEEATMEFESEARLFMRAWAQHDGAAAVVYLEGKGQAASANATILSALGGWASSDPQAARLWAEETAQDNLREDLLFGVIDGWALVDFNAAADYAETRPRSDARTRFIDLLLKRSMAAGDIAGAQRWFSGISDNEHNEIFKQRAFDRVVDAMLYRDPAAAAQWIASQAGEAFVSNQAVDMTAMKLAATAPENALRWLASMPALDEGVSTGAQGQVMTHWASSDPQAAGQWLSERLDPPGFDAMAQSYSGAVVGIDAVGATEWAQAIQDDAQREAAMVEVARHRLRTEGEGAIVELQAAGLTPEQLSQAQTGEQYAIWTVDGSRLNISNQTGAMQPWYYGWDGRADFSMTRVETAARTFELQSLLAESAAISDRAMVKLRETELRLGLAEKERLDVLTDMKVR